MIGATIGNYTIVSQLGRGGMGEVFLAHTKIGTRVAIKMLSADVSSDEQHVQRFFNEALATEKIAHSGICKIHDVGHHRDRAYLVMEFLNGESLAARIRRLGRLSSTQIGVIGKQIASVLAATHRAGIVHRDLKPENIFIIPDEDLPTGERVKVLDFGIAKLTGTLANASPKTSGTMGTPTYMAPEQWTDSSTIDARVDFYALGCVVFEMACGRPPFIAATIGEACSKHLGVIPPTARSLVPDVPSALDALLVRLLAKRPEERPAMVEIRAAFDGLASTGDPVGVTLAATAATPTPVAVTQPLTVPPASPPVTTVVGTPASDHPTLVDPPRPDPEPPARAEAPTPAPVLPSFVISASLLELPAAIPMRTDESPSVPPVRTEEPSVPPAQTEAPSESSPVSPAARGVDSAPVPAMPRPRSTQRRARTNANASAAYTRGPREPFALLDPPPSRRWGMLGVAVACLAVLIVVVVVFVVH